MTKYSKDYDKILIEQHKENQARAVPHFAKKQAFQLLDSYRQEQSSKNLPMKSAKQRAVSVQTETIKDPCKPQSINRDADFDSEKSPNDLVPWQPELRAQSQLLRPTEQTQKSLPEA